MISIVVPAYNEEELIGKCIESLIHQITDQSYEVIVVDNNSTDRTYQVASKYKNRLDLKVLKHIPKGCGKARFAGFAIAKGDIILSLDGDAKAPVDWIETMTKPLFDDPEVVATAGTGRIEDCSPRINNTFNIAQPLAMSAYKMVFRHYWLTGFNFAIRAEIYNKAGGFNPDLTSNEDTDLAFRVSKLGKIKLIKCPVTVSGRRMKKGVARGFFSYIPVYLKYYALKKPASLSDIR